MKAVEKNTFYKSTRLTVGNIVTPNFSDIPQGGGSDYIELQGGYQGNFYTISGNVATTPAYGESTPVGGHLSVYVSGVTLANTPTLPQLELYRLKPGVSITEGTLIPAYLSGNSDYGGVDDSTNSFYPNGGSISVYHSVIDSDNYYMGENFDGADKTLGDIKIIKSAGTGVMEMGDAYLTISNAKAKGIGVGSLLGQYKTMSLKTYFSNDDHTVPIKPEGDTIEGVWRPQIDKRKTRKKKLTWKRPYWKWKDIKNLIAFKKTVGITSDLDASVQSTPGNTIFDDVYATADTNNPFTSDESNPLMMTTCELSTDKKYSGGQSFRMYHLWDYSTSSQYLQKSLGSKSIMPSMTRASIYNIPQPPLGFDKTLSSGMDPTTAVPEISMRMNIAKLGFTPYLTADKDAVGGARGFDVCSTYYPSGTGNAAAGIVDTASIETLTSLLRSVVITWSNYKPKTDHTTLDRFLDYGLERFYTGETTENIVGGVAFFKTGIDGTSDPSVVYASALPVTKWNGVSGTALASSRLLASGGLARGKISTGTDLASTTLVCTDRWVNGIDDTTTMVPLPMDSWFNMRVFYDKNGPNGPGSASGDVYYGADDTALYYKYG